MTGSYPKDLDNLLLRTMDACENAALCLEALQMLKEYELGAKVEYDQGDPYVVVDGGKVLGR